MQEDKVRATKEEDGWMANGCLEMIREKLSSLIPMKGCPPMFYPEAIHNLYVWTAKASRDCQREDGWHEDDLKKVSACLKERIKKYLESRR